VFIVAPRWCGLVAMLAMISVSAGEGTDGSRTPMMVAVRGPRVIVLPITAGSLLKERVQNRCVRTTAPTAAGPSSEGFSRRPRTGRRPITSKNDPPTTPARTSRGSPAPIIVNSIVEKSPKAPMVVARALRSLISGTENVMFSVPIPGALWRR